MIGMNKNDDLMQLEQISNQVKESLLSSKLKQKTSFKKFDSFSDQVQNPENIKSSENIRPTNNFIQFNKLIESKDLFNNDKSYRINKI